MSEKRILCTKVSGECKYFANINTPVLADAFECKQGLYCSKNSIWKFITITEDTCKNCKHVKYEGVTREQAIEKMAKAMAAVSNITYVSEEQWKVVENGLRISAEAALNALLEANNDSKN